MDEKQRLQLKRIQEERYKGKKVFGGADVSFLLGIIAEQSAQLEMWAVNADEAAKRAQEREAKITSLREQLSLCEEDE